MLAKFRTGASATQAIRPVFSRVGVTRDVEQCCVKSSSTAVESATREIVCTRLLIGREEYRVHYHFFIVVIFCLFILISKCVLNWYLHYIYAKYRVFCRPPIKSAGRLLP